MYLVTHEVLDREVGFFVKIQTGPFKSRDRAEDLLCRVACHSDFRGGEVRIGTAPKKKAVKK